MLPVRYTVLKTFTSRYTNVFGSLIGNYSQTSTQWLLLGQKKNNCSRQHFNIDHQSSIPHGLPTMSWDIRQLFVVCNYTPAPRRGRGVYCFTSVRPSVRPPVQDIFRRIFLSNCWWQKSDIWSQPHIMRSVFGPIRFLLPVWRLCWFLYTLNIYAHFLSHFSQQLLMAEIWYLVTSFI